MNINVEHVWLKSDDEIAVLNAINWLYRVCPKAGSYTAVEIIKVAGPGGGRRPALKALTERGILKLKDGARYAFPEARTPSSDYSLKKNLIQGNAQAGIYPRSRGVDYLE